MRRFGVVEKQATGVQISMSMGITIRHCSIYEASRAGINISEGTFGGHLIEFCDVFDTVRETGDHGSFNSWGRDRFWRLEDAPADELPQAGAAGRGRAHRAAQQPLALRPRLGRRPGRRLVELRDLQQPVPERRPETARRIPPPRLEQHRRQQQPAPARLVRQQRRRGHQEHLHGRLPPCRRHAEGQVGKDRSTTTCSPPRMPTAPSSPPTVAMPIRWSATRCSSIRPTATIACRTGSPALKLGFENFPMDQFGVQKPALKKIARTPELPAAQADSTHDTTAAAEGDDALLAWSASAGPRRARRIRRSASARNPAVSTWPMCRPVRRPPRDGFKTDDLIQSVNDRPVRQLSDLLRLRDAAAGQPLSVGIVRGQQAQTLQVDSYNYCVAETSVDADFRPCPGVRRQAGCDQANSDAAGYTQRADGRAARRAVG